MRQDPVPKKRRRITEENGEGLSSSGIRPLGNALLLGVRDKAAYHRSRQLGSFAVWPDELIMEFLMMGLLSPREMRLVGYTSRVWFAFCSAPELWKQVIVNTARPPNSWNGSWRSTFFEFPPDTALHLNPGPLFSDVLFRPLHCATLDIAHYMSRKDLARNAIPVLDNVSPSQFNHEGLSDKPFILKAAPGQLPKVNLDKFCQEYGDVIFRQESVDWKLSVYTEYMKNNSDESPLYLFDRNFSQKTDLTSRYSIPKVFEQDYFSVLGQERPDHRWLILGPRRSGSTFHKDPNGTCAWNAVLQGEKYWIMFPPDILPPGVFTSPDESEVASPLSIAEWVLGFYKTAKKADGFMHGICSAGETIYVPSGWWHMVVNLSDCIAVTQNFVPESKLPNVLSFLRDKKDQISGFCEDDNDNSLVADNVYDKFIDRLKSAGHQDVLSNALTKIALSNIDSDKNSWASVVQESQEGFSFGF